MTRLPSQNIPRDSFDIQHQPKTDQSFENALAKARASDRLDIDDAIELLTTGTDRGGIDLERKKQVLEAADRRRAEVVDVVGGYEGRPHPGGDGNVQVRSRISERPEVGGRKGHAFFGRPAIPLVGTFAEEPYGVQTQVVGDRQHSVLNSVAFDEPRRVD
jgi:hypothetical protein